MRFLFILVFLLSSFLSFSQVEGYENVVIYLNKDKSKSESIAATNSVLLLYKGYLGQEEVVYAMVDHVTDTSLFIVKKKNSLFEHQTNELYEVKLIDILGFKKVTQGRTLLKAMSKLTLGIGTALLFATLNNNGSGFWKAFAISAGTGALGDIGVEFIFREKIKYKISDGWNYKVLKY